MTSFPKQRERGPTATIELLDHHHAKAFSRAISNVLRLDVTEFTLAQLMDGLPVAEVATASRYGRSRIHREHPIREHTTLCSGVREKTKEWIEKFDSASDVQLEVLVTIFLPLL